MGKQAKQHIPVSTLEMVFVLLMILPWVLPHGKAIDAEHARNAALFRFALGLTGFVGSLFFTVKRWLAPKVPANGSALPAADLVAPVPRNALTTASPAGDVAANPWDSTAATLAAPAPPAADDTVPQLSITYASTLAGHLRCNFYIVTRRKQTLLSFCFLPMVASLWSVGGLISGNGAEVVSSVLRIAFNFLAWFAFIMGLITLESVLRMRKPAEDRTCTSILTPAGLFDVTRRKRVFRPWQNITGVRENGGDIFIWEAVQGNYIPREAFAGIGEARQFFEAADTLWRSNGATIPAPLTRPAPKPAAPGSVTFDLD